MMFGRVILGLAALWMAIHWLLLVLGIWIPDPETVASWVFTIGFIVYAGLAARP